MKNHFAHFLFGVLIFLSVFILRVNKIYAFFDETGTSTGSFVAAVDWTTPSSTVSPLSAYQSNVSFQIPFSAADGESGLALVALYARKGNSGPYTLFDTASYSGQVSVSGNFSFAASEGDGDYFFYTVATDVAGNSESAPSTADATTQLDTIKPVTTLATQSGYTIGERIINGNFAQILDGWSARGQVWVLPQDTIDTGSNTLTIEPPSGSGFMARIGEKENTAGESLDGRPVWSNELSQTITRSQNYLSFYWRAVSFDTSDNPAVVVMANDKEILRVTGSDISTFGYPNDSGWHHAFLDFSTLTDEHIELRFYAGNTDPFNIDQSWLYISDVTTGKLAISSSSTVILTGSDGGNGVGSVTYSINGGDPISSISPATIPGSVFSDGLNTLAYFSTDSAGNVEDSFSSYIARTDSAPNVPELFSAYGLSEHEIATSWIAPADSSYFFRASAYGMRMSTIPMDVGNFGDGISVPNIPAPATAGEIQSFTISGLQAGLHYWIGIAACDPIEHCSDPVITDAQTVIEHVVDPGDVVINEIQWMGTNISPNDQWIELRNMTDQPVDITGWQLTMQTSVGESPMYTVSTSASIPANGYFLISQFDETNSALKNPPDLISATGTIPDPNFEMPAIDVHIKLYKGDWTEMTNLIDTADDGDGEPAAGLSMLNGVPAFYAMERNAMPGNGADASNWHTVFADTNTYFDDGMTSVRGTPGGVNQSEVPLPTEEPLPESSASATPMVPTIPVTMTPILEPTVVAMPTLEPTPENFETPVPLLSPP